jgi:hypothetical protein
MPTFTVSGVVRDGAGETPLGNVTVGFGDVRFNDCREKLPPTVTTVTDSNGRYSLDVPAASSIPSVLSFNRPGFSEVCGELSMKAIRRPLTINVIMPRAACASAGVGFVAVTHGTDYIDLTWPEVSGAHGYRLEVGDRNGLNEGILGVGSSPFATANVSSVTTGGAAHYRWNTPNLAPGHYFIRISAKLDCGWGPILSQPDITVQ